MPRRRKSTDTLPFDTLRLEGSLFVPELLERASRGEATAQKEADYAIPKGLKLHDEYGRAFRIATALWQDFAAQLPRRDLDPAATTRAFASDLLRQCLGYTDLTLLAEPFALGDRAFPVTALASGGSLPVIIAPHTLGLDDPDPQFAILGSGAKKKSAHQLAQEFLNASRDHLWAIVTNGKSLRLLRDAETLTRPNFLEIDLETILRESEDRYADFSALWRILHASRAPSSHCSPITDHSALSPIWETWKSEGHAQGLRVRDGLRDGVQNALLTLGTGFLNHPENTALRARLADGTLTKDAYFQQLLRLIYRFLFLFCAEERDLLHPPAPTDSSDIQNSKSNIEHSAARAAYARGYALRRFRTRSLRRAAHDRHADLWVSIKIVHRALATGQEKLALPALGGLFAADQCPDLDTAALANHDLLAAMRHLRWANIGGRLTAIDYRNMGPEELGSVYESLLELIPTIDLPARRFGFAGITDDGSTAGNTRKTTGSYYTPDSLVQELIKSALDPVIAQKIADHPENPVAALLSFSVCDPSCGSGHFLLAAGRRLAEKLAELRSTDGAVRPEDYRHALREVASRCLYGVDINPMAVELCRVALWLETVDPGKPLGFLDHHIRHGNSLLGTTPELIAAGLPDDTFKAIEGDDKKACAELKKRNKKEREGFGPLFADEENQIREKLRIAATAIEGMDDSRPDLLAHKATAFATAESSPEHQHAKLLADLWCAAFVIKKRFPSSSPISNLESQITDSPSSQSPIPQPDLFGQPVSTSKPTAKPKSSLKTENFKLGTASGITTGTLRDFVQGKPLLSDLQSEVTQLAQQYRFFHWHLAFPQVFDQGGFDCILGNPPWERVKLQEKEWFSERRPDIADAPNAATRKRLVAELLRSDGPAEVALQKLFYSAVRQAEGESHVLRNSGLYPLCGRGDINLYTVFAERIRCLLTNRGLLGAVLPSGIATDDTTKFFFQDIIEKRSLVNLFDFENKKGIFPAVDSNMKFCLFVCGSTYGQTAESAKFVFFAQDVEDVLDDNKIFELTPDDITLLNPNTRTCPVFRSKGAAELTKLIYRRVPVLIREIPPQVNLWGVTFTGMFHMTNDAGDFRTQEHLHLDGWRLEGNTFLKGDSKFIPLYEAKMMHHFDHRFAHASEPEAGAFIRAASEYLSEQEHQDSEGLASPRFWVSESLVADKLRQFGWTRRYFLGFRNVTGNVANVRTAVFATLPYAGFGNSLPLLFPTAKPELSFALAANLTALVFDFAARQKVGGINLNFYLVNQLPVLPPETYAKPCPWALHPQSTIHDPPSLRDWLLPRALELTYTAWDLEAFAADCGWPGPPFRWDEDRRFLLRCELDAAFFHLYLGSEEEWGKESGGEDGTTSSIQHSKSNIQNSSALTRAFPTPRDAVSYIMDTFPIVKRKDEAKHNGQYRTKETILQIYDALAHSIATGTPYQTLLDPPPADPTCCHPPKA